MFKTINAEGLKALDSVIGALSSGNRADLFHGLAVELEQQTKTRIQQEKTDPENDAPWKPWSINYARTRQTRGADGQERHSLLINEGHLLQSIVGEFDDTGIAVGTNLVYAPWHQHTRPFLGISRDNREDLEDLVQNFYDERLADGAL